METAIQQSDSAFKRSNIKSASSETKNSCVILVCIQNNSGVNITHDLLHTIFSPYGKILRILIFEKLKIWKAFVEYSTVDAAMNAKQNLNNFMIFNDGSRMSIHNANLETVKFQNNNPGGIDYTLPGNKPISEVRDENKFDHANLPQHQTPNYPMHNRIDNFSHSHNMPHNVPDYPHETLHKQHHSERENIENPITEEQNEGDEDEKNDSPAEPYPSRNMNPNANIHTVTAQLYRDNSNMQQQRQRSESPVQNSLPPGLMIPQRNISQSQQQGMPRITRMPQTQSMNFIPLSTADKQYSHGHLPPPNQIGAPLTRLTSFGSHNSLTMPSGPSNNYNHSLQENIPQMEQMNQPPKMLPRPGLNKPFYSQQELPMVNSLNKERIPTITSQGLVGFPGKQLGGRNQLGSFEYEDLSNLNLQTLEKVHQNLSLLLGKDTGEENVKSRVLYIKGLEGKDIKVDMLYNIFSNFGNILKILFIPSKTSALIEFENAEYSTICMDYLNNIVFMGKPLRIYYSKYSIINLRNKKGEEPGEEIFIGSQKTNRFKKNKNISINPPSSTLHLSNLLKEVCTEETIRAHFSSYGRIEAIKFILMENNKNMCLLRMASLEESLNAMAYLHDSDIGGRPVQISFTRSKI